MTGFRPLHDRVLLKRVTGEGMVARTPEKKEPLPAMPGGGTGGASEAAIDAEFEDVDDRNRQCG